MAVCDTTYNKPVGVSKAVLFENKRVQFYRPDINKENEVQIRNYEGQGIIISNNSNPSWSRTRSIGANRKQMLNEVLNFNLIGNDSENKNILKLLRESVYGFIMQLTLNNGNEIIFESPVYLRNETTLNFNNGTVNVTIGYSIPSFNNYLTFLADTLGNQGGFFDTANIGCSTYKQAVGVNKAILYVNDNIKLIRPDITKENEIHLINYAGGAIVIDNNDLPAWTRTTTTGANYKEMFQDNLQFNLIGLSESNENILKKLYEESKGFIMELQLNNGENIIFPTPVFMQKDSVFDFNNGNSVISISYSVPTFDDYLIKLNNLVFAFSFIFTGPDKILGYTNNGDPIIKNF